jgi:hypothetical protein
LGAIVGGTVGGTIALIAFIASLWYFCLRNKQAPATVQNDEFFRYNSVPAQHPNEVFAGTVGSGNFNHNPSNTNTSTVPTVHLTPLRRPPSGLVIQDPPYLHQQSSQQSDLTAVGRPSGPVIPEPPYLHQQTSQQSDLTPLRRPSEPVIPYLYPQTSQQSDLASTSSNPTTSGVSNQSNNVDIRALAQEVAAVLYQNPAMNYSSDPRGQMSVVQNHDYANTSQLTHQHPPSYRTAPSSIIGSPRKAPYT